MAGAWRRSTGAYFHTQNVIGPSVGPPDQAQTQNPVSKAQVWITRTNYLALRNAAQAISISTEDLLNQIIEQRLEGN